MSPTVRFLACAIVAILATSVLGAAASLGLTRDAVGAGSADVLACDDHAVSVDYTGDPGPVTALVVTQLADACNGGTAWATIAKTDGTFVSGTSSGAVSGGSVTILLPPTSPVAAEDVKGYSLVVVKP